MARTMFRDRLGLSDAVLRQAAEAEGRELTRRERRYREVGS